MSKTKGYTHLSEAEFKGMRALLDANVKVAVIARATDRSYNTVNNISKYKTYEDYKNRNKPVVVDKHVYAADPNPTVLTKLNNIETLLNNLLEVIQEKESHANVGWWKR